MSRNCREIVAKLPRMSRNCRECHECREIVAKLSRNLFSKTPKSLIHELSRNALPHDQHPRQIRNTCFNFVAPGGSGYISNIQVMPDILLVRNSSDAMHPGTTARRQFRKASCPKHIPPLGKMVCQTLFTTFGKLGLAASFARHF